MNPSSQTANQSTQQPNQRFNKKRNRKAVNKVADQIAAPRANKRPPVFIYNCSSCGEQLFKEPLVVLSKDSDQYKKGTGVGLGHWHCKCGNKKATRSKPKTEVAVSA
jgi:hypothetical protein